MLKTTLILVIGLTCASVFSAGKKPLIAPILKHRYAELVHDFKTHNVKDYSSMLTPGYKITAMGHTMTKSMAVSDFARQSKAMTLISFTNKFTHLAIYNRNKAVINVAEHFVGKFGGKNTFDLTAKRVDTWVSTAHGWMMSSSVISSMSPHINGKALPAR